MSVLTQDIGSVQFLAISTAQSDSAIGSRGPPDAPGVIQVWTVNHEANKARCGLVLCLEGGAALDLKWMPLGAWDDGGDSPRLGVLAAVQEDGSVSFYSVPRLASTVETKGDPVYSMTPR